MTGKHRNLFATRKAIGMMAAALALSSIALAGEQPVRQVITLSGASPANSPAARGAKEPNLAASYRGFATTRVGSDSEPEILTLQFHEATKVTAISATGDFHITGGSCSEGRAYSDGDSCTVEMTFTPRGPGHRTGRLSVAHTASAQPLSVITGGEATGPAVSFIPALIETVPSTANALSDTAQGLAIDGGDNLYIADTGNNLIRWIDSSGELWTLAGGGKNSSSNYRGPGDGVELSNPFGVAVDAMDDVYFSDTGNNVIRATTNLPNLQGTVSTVNLALFPPEGLAVDPAGNAFYLGADITGSTYLYEVPPTLGYSSAKAELLSLVSLDGDIGTDSFPLAVDANDDVFFASELPAGALYASAVCNIFGQNSVESNDNLGKGARFWIVAGSGQCGYSGDGGLARGAEISTSVQGFAWDAAGNFYFTDTGNNVVRRIDASTGIIRTVAGNGTAGYSGDGGQSTKAELNGPTGVAVDSRGNIYVISFANKAPSAADKPEEGSDAEPKIIGPKPVGLVREIGARGKLEFGAQTISTTSARTILLSNVGNAALNVTAAVLSSGSTGDFAIDPDTTSCNFTVPIATGASCNIGITFTPSATGARRAVLTLLDDTVTGGDTIEVSGTGDAAASVKPKVTLASKANPAKTGEIVEFETKVESESSIKPAGEIELKEGDRLLATGELSSGSVAFRLSNLSAGAHLLTAYYPGDKQHEAAESNSVKEIVNGTGNAAAIPIH